MKYREMIRVYNEAQLLKRTKEHEAEWLDYERKKEMKNKFHWTKAQWIGYSLEVIGFILLVCRVYGLI